jgi:hypothetical protein
LRLAPPGRPEPAHALEVTPALAPASRAARRHGLTFPSAGARGYELRLPGIGGRYLIGVAEHATANGWPAEEVAALLTAIEDRSAMWIVSAPRTALARAGLDGGRGRLPGAGAARWSGGRWASTPVPEPAVVADLVAAGVGRGAVCAAAVSGAARHAPEHVLRAAAAAGARTATMRRGLAAELGARWVAELLIAPALPTGSLVTLREQVAAAPRCGWCGGPLLGSICRRCIPEPDR